MCCFLIIVSFCPMNAILASFKVRTTRTSKHAKMAFIEQTDKEKTSRRHVLLDSRSRSICWELGFPCGNTLRALKVPQSRVRSRRISNPYGVNGRMVFERDQKSTKKCTQIPPPRDSDLMQEVVCHSSFRIVHWLPLNASLE